MEDKVMKRIAFWGRFMGVVTIILGALSAIGGLFCFIVGAIPGVLGIITGYFLFKSGSEAAVYTRTAEKLQIEGVLEFYSKYLLLQGILLVIGIVLAIIGFLLMGSLVIMGFHHFHQFQFHSTTTM